MHQEGEEKFLPEPFLDDARLRFAGLERRRPLSRECLEVSEQPFGAGGGRKQRGSLPLRSRSAGEISEHRIPCSAGGQRLSWRNRQHLQLGRKSQAAEWDRLVGSGQEARSSGQCPAGGRQQVFPIPEEGSLPVDFCSRIEQSRRDQDLIVKAREPDAECFEIGLDRGQLPRNQPAAKPGPFEIRKPEAFLDRCHHDRLCRAEQFRNRRRARFASCEDSEAHAPAAISGGALQLAGISRFSRGADPAGGDKPCLGREPAGEENRFREVFAPQKSRGINPRRRAVVEFLAKPPPGAGEGGFARPRRFARRVRKPCGAFHVAREQAHIGRVDPRMKDSALRRKRCRGGPRERAEPLGPHLRPPRPALVAPKIMVVADEPDTRPGRVGGEFIGEDHVSSQREVVSPDQCARPGFPPQNRADLIPRLARKTGSEILECGGNHKSEPRDFFAGRAAPDRVRRFPADQGDFFETLRQFREKKIQHPPDPTRPEVVMDNNQFLRGFRRHGGAG